MPALPGRRRGGQGSDAGIAPPGARQDTDVQRQQGFPRWMDQPDCDQQGAEPDQAEAMADRLSGCMDTGYHPGADGSGDGNDPGGETAGMDIQVAGFAKGRLQPVLYRRLLA